jgi:hypothetical protein
MGGEPPPGALTIHELAADDADNTDKNKSLIGVIGGLNDFARRAAFYAQVNSRLQILERGKGAGVGVKCFCGSGIEIILKTAAIDVRPWAQWFRSRDALRLLRAYTARTAANEAIFFSAQNQTQLNKT